MAGIWFYSLVSVFLVSLISFVGIIGLSMKAEKLGKALIYLVSFSAGALFGDVFIHLLPESTRRSGFGMNLSLGILFGILIFFIIEKFIHWKHDHLHSSGKRV